MKTTMEQLLEAIDGRPFVEEVSGKMGDDRLKDGRSVEIYLIVKIKGE